ncbi:TIGR03618 family F420-dependent PPOX class oxidoreductase [Streptomyces sp. BPTC-684]|uniref:pyridoxamine 5'-phosphate oxidase family protein n=1 Tax=Streptomyces sp. BPTC-684 TaxID=3043734 RepID=UPI0024B1318F|nr:TIGR03618 family F420-dependent PPOX class oxidoreductase [Streptomyces sp. BPTC-684]WHM36686.1 TIGR03618 family F420-dependent PPOX class oxidoreductase [Streptomyces sp. BPTC-684]
MTLPRGRTSAVKVSASVEAFLTEPLTATLTTLRPDGSPHVAPVRFTWDAASGLARVMTVVTSRKARNVLANPGGRAVLCQVEGFAWVTLEGTGTVSDDPARVAEGVKRYAKRYWSAPPNPPGRVVLEIAVDRVMNLNT